MRLILSISRKFGKYTQITVKIQEVFAVIAQNGGVELARLDT